MLFFNIFKKFIAKKLLILQNEIAATRPREIEIY